jgi:uroporphyrin-III C-methyltransferase/precorrin-2 dehydrogenase/sirohydrochlorin ferrochelatase
VKASRTPVETKAWGFEPLAVLPVFVKLQGRRAVIAGGNAGAAWKAKLLAAAGAEVLVVAPELSEEMRLAPTEAAAGSITIKEGAWAAEDLAGAAFAVAALDEEGPCAAFVESARRAGAIVNAVDRPQLCDVQFGAIVNRSPLVVGIATEGAAPVFGQAIRSRIEALLPRGFGRWLGAAKTWRDRVLAAFATSPQRRVFWERFSDLALAEPNRAPSEGDFLELAAAAERSEPLHGSVALVGAGPGDPELLTLKAVRALRTADVILYDDLVAPEILDFARREAKTMLVGKTGHGPSCRQEEINRLMVSLARGGRRVVRLKGGDPLIFGRAGEEIEACRASGLRVEVIPGVTSAQAAAAVLGASLTDRAVARRVQFVTGHDRRGDLPKDVNWSALADPAATTAIYMPKATLPELLSRAVEEGLAEQTPAVALFNLTRDDEHIEFGTVADLVAKVSACPASGPALVLVGESLRLAQAGRPFERAQGMTRAGA